MTATQGIFYDRVKTVVLSAPGTGALALGTAVAGFRPFYGVVPDAQVVSYVIEDGANWECGHGTFRYGSNTLERTAPLVSTSANGPITATNAAIVYITILAEDIAAIIAGDSTTVVTTGSGSTTTTDPYGAHVYWQLLVTGSLSGPNSPSNSTQLEVGELQFKALPGGATIDPTGSTAFAYEAAAGVVSTNTVGNYVGYEPYRAFDASETSTFISSDGNITGHENTIGIQFATATHVQELTIVSPTTFKTYTGGPVNFDVQYSDDGQNWTTAWGVEDTTASALANAGSRTYTSPDLVGGAASTATTYTDTFGAHKWWQIEVTAPLSGPNGAQTQLEVGDLQFRSTPNGPAIPAGENVAFSFSGSTNLNNYTGHEPYRAFDTSTTSTYISPDGNITGHNNTLGIEFEKATHVQEVAVLSPNAFAGYTGGPVNFAVQYSDDGQAWTTAWTVADTVALVSGGTRVYTAPSLTAGSTSSSTTVIPKGKGSGDPHYAWRFKVTTTFSNTGECGFEEATMASSAGGVNYATGATGQFLFASSTESGRTPAQGCDQNTSSLWGTAPSSAYPAIWGIIYSQKRVMLSATIQASTDGYWVHLAPQNFTVEWSDDTTTGLDGTWTVAYTVTGSGVDWSGSEIRTFSNTSPTYGAASVNTVPSGGTIGQVLTKASATDFDTEWTTLTASGSGSGTTSSTAVQASSAKFQLAGMTSSFGGNVGMAEVTLGVGTNATLPNSVEGDSGTLSQYPANNAVDSNVNSFWATGSTGTFELDYTTAFAPDTLKITTRNDSTYYTQGPQSFNLNYWNGTAWVTIASFSHTWTTAGEVATFAIPKIAATVTNQRTGNGWRINYCRSADATYKSVAEMTFRDVSTAVLTSTSTIESDEYNSALTSSNSVDGITTSKWASNQPLPYLGQMFSSQVTPNSLEITASQDDYYTQTVTEGEIEYTPDGGVTWHYVCGFKFSPWTAGGQSQYFLIPAV